MWTTENRPRYNRDRLRYPSESDRRGMDALSSRSFRPASQAAANVRVIMREIVNGVMYILSTGCQWRYLAQRPAAGAARCMIISACGTGMARSSRIHHALYVKCREQAEREGSPTACIIDSQSVKSAEKGGLASIRPALMRAGRADQRQEAARSGRHAGTAAAQHRTPPPTCRIAMTASRLLATLFGRPVSLPREVVRRQAPTKDRSFASRWPCILPLSENRNRQACRAHQRVRCASKALGSSSARSPRLNRCRRLAKDWENLSCNALAFLKLASIRLMLRKLCNPC